MFNCLFYELEASENVNSLFIQQYILSSNFVHKKAICKFNGEIMWLLSFINAIALWKWLEYPLSEKHIHAYMSTFRTMVNL